MTADDRRAACLLAVAVAILVAIIYLAGCAGPQKPQNDLRQWAHESAVIVVDNEAPPCLFQAVLDALDFLRPRVNVSVERGLMKPPRPGEIVIRWRQQPPGALGITWASLDSKYVYRATIDVPQCHMRLVAHELGHAFGLENVEQKNRLMTHAYNQGWFLLSQAEVEALRRREP